MARAEGVESVDESLVHAYDGVADELSAEIEDLLGAQAWPSDWPDDTSDEAARPRR